MSIIKEIYINNIKRTNFKSSSLVINGKTIKENSKFNIFNSRIIDLNQNGNFSLDYILEIYNVTESRVSDPINGLQIKPPSVRATDPINGLQIKPPSVRATDPINGLQIKPPSKNVSSMVLNGQLDSNISTVKIDGIEINDKTKIELYINVYLIKNSLLKIIFNVDKDNLLKLTRLKK